MANSDASSSTTCTVRVLVSFYLAAPDDSSSARTSPIHKEKFNVPLSYFFLQKPLKTRINSKYQSKGSTYILHLLAFVEIRLFNVFLWERKAGFGKLMKNVRDAGFLRKRGRKAGSGPPFQTLSKDKVV